MSLLQSLFGKGPDLKELLKEGSTVVDVRSPGEFAGGHVANSINIPVDQIDRAESKLKTMKQPIILCCASGMRSGMATSKVKNMGIDCVNGGSWTNVNASI